MSGMASSVPECCSYIDEPVDLIHCVTTTSNAIVNTERKPSDVSFVVFASENIYNYASLTLLINSYYAETRGYSLQFLREGDSDFFPEDRRWNKIASVIEALNPESGWAKDVDILVAIDADLIVMDLSFDVRSVVNTHPKADIFMSSDPSDVGNTGFIIVRNTKWAYTFFQTWWEMRYSFSCDQHALNDLYSRLLQTKKSRNKIAILAAGAINSEFPVYSTFDDTSKVLHMVGEHNEIRQKVFEEAARGLCVDYIDNEDDEDGFAENEDQDNMDKETPRKSESGYGLVRYGLTRAVIARTAEEYITTLLEGKYRECSGLLYDAPPAQFMHRISNDEKMAIMNGIDSCLQSLHSISSQMCGYGRGIMKGREDRCVAIYDDNFKLVEKTGHMVPIANALLIDHSTKNLYDSFLLGGSTEASISKGEQVVVNWSCCPIAY